MARGLVVSRVSLSGRPRCPTSGLGLRGIPRLGQLVNHRAAPHHPHRWVVVGSFNMFTEGVIAILCIAVLIAKTPYEIPQQPQPPSPAGQTQNILNPDQLDRLVAPVALYPDPILSQVLVAST